jgi:uncharacterized protein YcgI (DUF1989 family)
VEIIQPKSAQAFSISEGQTLKIVDVEGHQVADLVAFAADDHDEWLSQGRTRLNNWSLKLQVGDGLYSNRNREIFSVLEDRGGAHDLLFPPCSAFIFEHQFGQPGRTGCHEHLGEALGVRRIGPDRITDTLNAFMNTGVEEDGRLVIEEPLSRAGDYITLMANLDCLIAVSACAEDISACNAGNCTPIGVEIL